MRLSVALDGAGWYPAAWREPRARVARAAGPRGEPLEQRPERLPVVVVAQRDVR